MNGRFDELMCTEYHLRSYHLPAFLAKDYLFSTFPLTSGSGISWSVNVNSLWKSASRDAKIG